MPHYFETPTDTFRPTQITFVSRNKEFSVTAGSGVFSKHAFDKATALLLEHVKIQEDTDVLDLGCGWGPVGLVLKTCYPSLRMVMSDTNPRAVQLAKKNMEKYHVEAKVVVSNSFNNIEENFDTILLNPPMAAGREVCAQLITDSQQHVKQGGQFYLVARYQKGGKMLQSLLEEVFGNCETVAKGGGFRVFRSVKE